MVENGIDNIFTYSAADHAFRHLTRGPRGTYTVNHV